MRHPLSSNGRDPIIVRESPGRVAWINREARRLAARQETTMPDLTPFKVARDSTVTERTGEDVVP